MAWDYLGFGTFSGNANMEQDRLLLEQFQQGERFRPALRLYCWRPPTISLGTNQVAAEVVNLSEAARLGYEVVARPTGGRALLHKGDLCYAIAADRRSHPSFRSLSSTYRAIGSAIAEVLRCLGIELTDLPATGNDSRKSLNPCFALLSPFEVTVGGRKICGSAQFRSGDCFLQHGSLRVRDNWDQEDLSSIWPEGFALSDSLVTSIDRERQAVTNFAEVEKHFLAALRICFQVQIAGRT